MLIYYKAGTTTSGNRGHAGRKGKKGGSAPNRIPITASILSIKANSKLAGELDSNLRESPLNKYHATYRTMQEAGGQRVLAGHKFLPYGADIDNVPAVIDFVKEQQGYNGSSLYDTDGHKTKKWLSGDNGEVVELLDNANLITTGSLELKREARINELFNDVLSIEQNHLLTNQDLSNLKNKEWKEKKIELALISAGGMEAYATMQGYDAIKNTDGTISVLNKTKIVIPEPVEVVVSKVKNPTNGLSLQDGIAFTDDSPYMTDKIKQALVSKSLDDITFTELNTVRNEIKKVYSENNPGEVHYDVILAALQKERGYSEKPQIISDNEALSIYQDAIKNGGKINNPDNIIMFRGVADNGEGAFIDQMKNGSHYAGAGIYGNGTYMAGLDTASEYASSKKNIQPIFLDSRTKFVSHTDFDKNRNTILGKMKAEVDTIEKNHLSSNPDLSNLDNPVWRQKKLSYILSRDNESNWGVIHGYDGFYIESAGGSNKPYFNMWNRSKMRMTNSTVADFDQSVMTTLRNDEFQRNYYWSLQPDKKYDW